MNLLKDNTNMENYTYDVHFDNDEQSSSKGFAESYQYCLDYIKQWNGSNHSYFKDYKGGVVSIYCNETGEHVYFEDAFNVI